jgi:hypothetical protein
MRFESFLAYDEVPLPEGQLEYPYPLAPAQGKQEAPTTTQQQEPTMLKGNSHKAKGRFRSQPTRREQQKSKSKDNNNNSLKRTSPKRRVGARRASIAVG